MTKRSRQHKQRFTCGHKGFGHSCQRCIVQSVTPSISTKQFVKQEWLESFNHDPIDLRGLPERVIRKARRILQKLMNGECYMQFKGKRFRFDRTLITIPVTRRYRLLCRDYKSELVPLQVLSHAAYNSIAANKISV